MITVLIRMELRKIFNRRFLLIATAFLLCLNFYQMDKIYIQYVHVQNGSTYTEVLAEKRRQLSGTLTTDNVGLIVQEYRRLSQIYKTQGDDPGTYTQTIRGDYSLFSTLYADVDYAWNYQKRMEENRRRALDNVAFYSEHGNLYDTRINQQIADIYANRSITTYADTWGVQRYISFDFSSLCILLLLALGLAPLFAGERESGMAYLLLTSRYGRGKTVRAKLMAAVLFTVIISSLFQFADFTAFSLTYGFNGLSCPIYSLSSFEATPLNCTTGQYFLLNFALKLLGFLTAALMCAFLSAISNGGMESFLFSAAALIALSLWNNTAFYNPVALLTPRNMLTDYQIVPLFNHPILSIIAAAFVSAFICILALNGSIILETKTARLSGSPLRIMLQKARRVIGI